MFRQDFFAAPEKQANGRFVLVLERSRYLACIERPVAGVLMHSFSMDLGFSTEDRVFSPESVCKPVGNTWTSAVGRCLGRVFSFCLKSRQSEGKSLNPAKRSRCGF